MPDHVLDRPAWYALTTRLAHVALGDERAVRLHPDYGLFSAPREFSRESLAALAELIPPRGTVSVAPNAPFTPPPGTTITQQLVLHQMLGDRLAATAPDFAVTALDDRDAAEMLALATLTDPGPFFRRTHQLGDFVGVRVDGKLVAMAGERMKLDGYTEISAVCTHPDHRGKGYAWGLMGVVARRIQARGETPILHVRAEKKAAIAVYERLGFRFRREIMITMLERA
ncbi:MAG: GNAT family N-acetyltransferase [Pseudomonadota bacterium]